MTQVANEVDRLYAAVVTEPERWNDERFDEWASDLDVGECSRPELRALRQCLRSARKLRDFWAEERAEVDAVDWRARVDVALGPRAWRPTLDLAMAALDRRPSPERFDDVKERFRLVNGAPWLEGVDYEQWRTSQGER